MKVTGNSEAASARGDVASGAQSNPRTRFSQVLKDGKQGSPEPGGNGAVPAIPVFGSSLPFSQADPVNAGGGVVAKNDALLASLVQEIAAEAPPGGSSSVDIQFNSRTLEGLHVRIQKTGDSVQVQFSTSSDGIAQLLSANSQSLTAALTQRGYVAPAVSVQREQSPMTFVAGESRRSGRDGESRGRQGQSGGQKRR
jgi:hypothetical protein